MPLQTFGYKKVQKGETQPCFLPGRDQVTQAYQGSPNKSRPLGLWVLRPPISAKTSQLHWRSARKRTSSSAGEARMDQPQARVREARCTLQEARQRSSRAFGLLPPRRRRLAAETRRTASGSKNCSPQWVALIHGDVFNGKPIIAFEGHDAQPNLPRATHRQVLMEEA